MVVVRESPRAHHSPDKTGVQWPPKSPFQALLSSPSGRKRWQDHQSRAEQRSPSPSPMRKSMHSSQKLQELANMDDDDQEDEDEETLQLKLQEIQAKLRLKKLQAKERKAEGAGGRASRQDSVRSSSPRKPNISPTRLYKAAIEVPVSPVRNARAPEEQMSPARRRLGLTSVPRAEEVSLKRARDGSQIKRSESRQNMQQSQREVPKVKSFSERLAQSRTAVEEKQAKKDHLDRIRSSGFTHTKADTPLRRDPESKGRVSRLADDSKRPSSAGQAQSSTPAKDASISRSASARVPREKEQAKPHARTLFNPEAYGQESGTGHDEGDSDASLDIEDADDQAGFDAFSKVHLKKRNIEHSVIAREMEGKEVYTVRRLLKEVKAPHYDPPDCESDYVVFAVLASKSQPFSHAESHKTAEQAKEDYQTPRNKFMVLHLTDLEWEIDCFLFGTAFNQFWKLTPGTLLAILNPAILPPKGNQNNGRFSLKLGSSEDAVMEIGIARDLGYCSAVKKDGQPCGEWINKRKAEACEFHISLQIEKNRKSRMEVNTMFRGARNPDDKIKSRIARDKQAKKSGGGASYHREYGQLYSVNSGVRGNSAASLLDKDDTDALHNMTQEEASRKRIANAQKERDLAKKLGEMGRGVGAEYMRSKHQHTTSTTTVSSTTSSNRKDISAAEEARNALFSKPSAAELGLLGKKASDAHLSPAKDRKKHFGLGAMSLQNGGSSATRTSEPMGWGAARKPGLLQPKESKVGSPERGQTRLDTAPRYRSQDTSLRSQGSSSPVKKKARFDLAKGIRMPGRDSLPGAAGGGQVDDDEDDDDLDIV
ncbi:hypothetical protein M409DRAFT_65869 [Zasmidium cellare ATCC 36951]|uniref:Uncharacterized protein n=1 Tax=Zasmidium cellare ATCC 36951 TaxID=1080233 RepID=A0A6A6CQL8_ZASCE|nr:uncharacterized protein M409DRAFT_65869 [Zasmidium cellare ATCC 36951]KAF2167766.1 hypothetical protein M409DRAFT_65869 [Zasmidium cellare ATCC 36951]